jgi:mRNA-degrading endonuclease RelE of RelBE toxin-antitoxin system
MSPRAIRDLDSLPPNIQKSIGEKIDSFEKKPRSWLLENSKKLESYKNRYRVAINDYRFIFKFQDGNLIIILLISHRKDIYKKLKQL